MAVALISLYLIDLSMLPFFGLLPIIFHTICVWLYFAFKPITAKRRRHVLLSVPVLLGIIGFGSIYLTIEAVHMMLTNADAIRTPGDNLRKSLDFTGARIGWFALVFAIVYVFGRGRTHLDRDTDVREKR